MQDIKELKFKAAGNFIIIHAKAAPAGSEVRSPSGILIGYRETGEIPVVGTVISVGDTVPKEVSETLLHKTVVIPNGNISNVLHPDVVSGKLTKEESAKDENKFISCHYTHIQAVYLND